MPLPVLPSPPPPPPRSLSLLPRSPAALPPRTLAPGSTRLRLRRCRVASLPIADDELLRAITNPAGPDARLPAVRSYDGDLSSLTLVGSVDYEQAVTAAAADGGDAAEEHLASGVSTMVVETLFPGSSDDRSTVSTTLFLPAKKVKQKAKRLVGSLTTDILAGNPSVFKNILAMTFRQVILLKVWSFKLTLFCPGTDRNMEDLASSREAPAYFTVSSSDVEILSALAEAVCSFALENTERRHFGKVDDSNYMFSWLQKLRGKCSVDSSICVYKISDREIEMNAMRQVDKFKISKGRASYADRKLSNRWWVAPVYSRLEKKGAPGLSYWANEFVPSYRLQINADMFKDAKLEGWHQIANNRWEVLLTHYQMVELANVLDLYYEDQYTHPSKQLLCNLITKPSTVLMDKSSSWKILLITFAGACIFIALGVLAQLRWRHLPKFRTSSESTNSVSSSEIEGCYILSHETKEVGNLCILVVKKMKDALGWPDDVHFDVEIGAWTGIVPSYLRDNDPSLSSIGSEEDIKSLNNNDTQPQTKKYDSMLTSSETNHKEQYREEQSSHTVTPHGRKNVDSHTSTQDIASFQVVLSRGGKIIGFQPTSRVAVNHWASNPLAKLLYEGRKLTPGLFEPGLKISLPREVVLLELLMSVDPESSFALARPIRQ